MAIPYLEFSMKIYALGFSFLQPSLASMRTIILIAKSIGSLLRCMSTISAHGTLCDSDRFNSVEEVKICQGQLGNRCRLKTRPSFRLLPNKSILLFIDLTKRHSFSIDQSMLPFILSLSFQRRHFFFFSR